MTISDMVLFAAIKLDPGTSGINAPVVSADANALKSVLSTVYLWAGIICVVIVIIGGVRYVTSGGDSSGIQSAKNTIIYALAGLVVVIAAAGITQLVIGRF